MDACLNPLSFISLWVQQQEEVVLQRYLSKLVIIDKDKNSDQLRPLNFIKYCIYSQSFSTTVRNTVDKWGKSHWKYIFYITSSKYFEIFFILVHFISAKLPNYIVGKIIINQSCPLFRIHGTLVALHTSIGCLSFHISLLWLNCVLTHGLDPGIDNTAFPRLKENKGLFLLNLQQSLEAAELP